MAVGTFALPSFPTQDPATYKSNIDAGFLASRRYLDAFAPHAQSTPNMTVALDAGFTFYAGALTEVAAQNTAAIAASSLAGITRIDRVVADMITGAVSVVQGTSVAPDVPAGKQPVAQVAMSTGSTAITNAMLTDERAFPGGRTVDYQVFTSVGAGTWNKPLGFSTNSKVIVMMWGSGAGGNSGATGAGGGGGACLVLEYRLSDLSTAVALTVPAGGAVGAVGANAVFNGVSVYGGGIGVNTGGGGGGLLSGNNSANNNGGSPNGGAGGTPGGDSGMGGGGGGSPGWRGGSSVYGGGGGGGGTGGNPGGNSVYGGAGGAGGASTAGWAGGVSVFGGNGGASGVAGSAPGGGGGRNAAGARGEIRVWVLP